MDDMVLAVDLEDNAITSVPKLDAHINGILHRAFSVVLYADNQILIQQRAFDKYHCAGLWSNTCCSHPKPTENILCSVNRRLEEELGIKQYEIEDHFELVYYSHFDNGLTEYEYDHIFIGQIFGDFSPNPNEVAHACFADIDELMERIENEASMFTPWFVLMYPTVYKYIKSKVAMNEE